MMGRSTRVSAFQSPGFDLFTLVITPVRNMRGEYRKPIYNSYYDRFQFLSTEMTSS